MIRRFLLRPSEYLQKSAWTMFSANSWSFRLGRNSRTIRCYGQLKRPLKEFRQFSIEYIARGSLYEHLAGVNTRIRKNSDYGADTPGMGRRGLRKPQSDGMGLCDERLMPADKIVSARADLLLRSQNHVPY